MCPQGHPHQLEPILLKHFPMVLKAKAKRKAKGIKCAKHKKQIARTHATHARKIWIRKMILRCLYVSLLRTYFSYIILRTHSNSIQTTQPPPPPHPYPTLIKKRKRLDEQDNTTTRFDMISPCQIICHTPIHDSWSMDNRQYWKLTFLTKIGDHWLLHDLLSNSAWVSFKTPGWPVTVKNSQSQSSSFLKWKTSFRSFFRKKSGSLDSGFLKHFYPLSTVLLSTISRVFSFNLKLGSASCNISSYRSK